MVANLSEVRLPAKEETQIALDWRLDYILIVATYSTWRDTGCETVGAK